ncbi:hypothetical protein CEXT_214331 [Caerostris extrusa]|uniref:Uncharacterized protein n=1 Tax=Caerostris extrusa TaxID=172846 RepID=A0AAV4N5R5_CAEEX|nr:hypothetical protein CEXT_214331 [Caerostris extrusa]
MTANLRPRELIREFSASEKKKEDGEIFNSDSESCREDEENNSFPSERGDIKKFGKPPVDGSKSETRELIREYFRIQEEKSKEGEMFNWSPETLPGRMRKCALLHPPSRTTEADSGIRMNGEVHQDSRSVSRLCFSQICFSYCSR